MVTINNNINTADLMTKLGHLEDQVTTLYQELAAKNDTITELTQSLAERQTQITELQAALNTATQTLYDKASGSFNNLQQQFQKNLNDKALNPLIQKIQTYIDILQNFVNRAKALINETTIYINNKIKTTSELLEKLPAITRQNLEQVVEQRIKSKIDELFEKLRQLSLNTQKLLEKQIISPLAFFYEDVMSAAKTYPEQCQRFLKEDLSKLASVYGQAFYQTAKEGGIKTVQSLLSALNHVLEKLIQQIKNYIGEHSSRPINYSNLAAAPA